MSNLRKAINNSINSKNKVKNFRLIDSQQTYRVVIMMARYWKCNVREAYKKYADYLYNIK
jgi:hypothetical protein